eukprot:4458687-Amphidinium_carterae.1
MDGEVNIDSPNSPWWIVLDAAPVHVAVDCKKRLYTYLQRPLKHSLQEQCAQSFAAEIMFTLQNGGKFKFDAGLVRNRLRLPSWVEVAMTMTMARVDVCNKA